MSVRQSADFVCDGVDDHLQIQRALDSVSQTGGTVVLASGEFRTDETLSVTGAGVRLTGLGPATRVASSNLSAHVLHAVGDSFELDHLAIGHRQPQTRNTKYVVFVERSAGVEIHDIEVTAGTAAGILLNGVNDSSVSDNVVHDTLADGIHVTGASSGVVVAGNTVYDTGDDAIAAVGYQSAGEPNTDIQIADNLIIRSRANGIKIEGTEASDVVGNRVSQTRYNGITVGYSWYWRTFGAKDVTIRGNLVLDANTYAAPDHPAFGVFVKSGSDDFPTGEIRVEGNTIVRGGHHMVMIGEPASKTATSTYDVAVVGNRMLGPNRAGSGLLVVHTTDIELSENRVHAAAGTAISVTRSVAGSVLVDGNVVRE